MLADSEKNEWYRVSEMIVPRLFHVISKLLFFSISIAYAESINCEENISSHFYRIIVSKYSFKYEVGLKFQVVSIVIMVSHISSSLQQMVRCVLGKVIAVLNVCV